MSIEWRIEEGNLVLFRVSGVLGIEAYQRAQSEMEASIKNLGKVNLLILLEDFSGWQNVEGWEDVSFVERNDRFIDKMAIVGDEKWRDMAYIFTLKGLRSVPIEYFTADAQSAARQWLAEATR